MSISAVFPSPVSSMRASRRKPLAACVAAVFALSATANLYAATAVVTNCNDDTNPGSLRWAAGQAINSGDVIDMTNITDTSACVAGKDGFTNTIAVGSAVTIATGVTINGPPVPALAVSGLASYGVAGRVFTANGNITINNLGIKYGKSNTTSGAGGVYGGCVYAKNNITMTGVTLDHCSAYTNTAGVGTKGGAVAAYNGSVTLTNSTVTHNDATSHNTGSAFGGAVYAFGSVTLNNSTVSFNVATANSGAALGGAIVTRNGGNVTTSGSTILHNSANSHGAGNAEGGGIYSSGTVGLTDSELAYSQAAQYSTSANSGARGGGIFAQGAVTLTSSLLGATKASSASTSASSSALGGVVYGASTVTLNNTNLEIGTTYTNGGVSRGGGIYSLGSTTAHYSNVFYNTAGGKASSRGGGIYSKGGLEMKYGALRDNSATSTSGVADGGGAIVEAGSTYLRGVTVSGNYAKRSFSALDLFSGADSSVEIVNSTISGNIVASGKNAVYVKAYTTQFYNSTFAYNTGGTGPGIVVNGGNAGSKAGLYSNLMSSNSYTTGTQNDFSKSVSVTFTATSSNNLIRNPGSIVPTGTLTGKCPLLHKLAFNGGPTETHRPGGGISASAGSKNPAIDAGSIPKALTSDQRGGTVSATSPARVSGSAADIGAYEVQQDDIIYDSEFETCPN